MNSLLKTLDSPEDGINDCQPFARQAWHLRCQAGHLVIILVIILLWETPWLPVKALLRRWVGEDRKPGTGCVIKRDVGYVEPFGRPHLDILFGSSQEIADPRNAAYLGSSDLMNFSITGEGIKQKYFLHGTKCASHPRYISQRATNPRYAWSNWELGDGVWSRRTPTDP